MTDTKEETREATYFPYTLVLTYRLGILLPVLAALSRTRIDHIARPSAVTSSQITEPSFVYPDPLRYVLGACSRGVQVLLCKHRDTKLENGFVRSKWCKVERRGTEPISIHTLPDGTISRTTRRTFWQHILWLACGIPNSNCMFHESLH
jgi:hypothetical protein